MRFVIIDQFVLEDTAISEMRKEHLQFTESLNWSLILIILIATKLKKDEGIADEENFDDLPF